MKENRRKRKGEEKCGRYRLHFCSVELHHKGSSSVIKAESCRIFCKKMNGIVDDYVAWSSKWIVDVTFHDNVFMGLDSGLFTRAVGGELREESLMIFLNRSISHWTCE